MNESMGYAPARRVTVRVAANLRRAEWLALALCSFGLVGVFALGVWLGYTEVDVWGAFFVPTVLLVLTVPVLSKIRWLRELELVGIASLALAAKFIVCYLRYLVEFHVYSGGDSILYHNGGSRIAEAFLEGRRDLLSLVPSNVGTDFIVEVNGLVALLSGRSLLASSMIFSWLSYVGILSFIAAVKNASGLERIRTYSVGLLFLPTLLFWTAALGKDAWMILGIGTFVLGTVKLSEGSPAGLFLGAFGGYATAAVRPHVTALLLVSLVFVFFGRWNRRSALGALFSIILLGALAGFVSASGSDLLPGFEAGLSEVLFNTSDRTTIGGSTTEVRGPNSVANYPVALFSVLFRPFIFEINSLLQFLAALEGTLLLVLLFRNWARIRGLLKRSLFLPYIRFSLIFVLGFGFAWSYVGNLGIIARQRAQVAPFLLAILLLSSSDIGSSTANFADEDKVRQNR